MSISMSVERLRVWLVAGAVLLLVVIGGFLGYAHYRAHRFLTELPARLGVDIRQETNGFTYSQSVKGKTIYTIHASKAVQRTDGKFTLHDVGIVLYGRGEGSSNRVDRIYGSEFEYDQKAEVIRAMGEVHIDLQAPEPVDANAKASYAAGHDPKGGEHRDERLIHVKTSGLVFLQRLGVAATDQDLEFEYDGMNGHAHGADYNSDTGVLMLQSAVKVNGVKQGHPVVLTAARAEIDRQKQQVLLLHAEYLAMGDETGAKVAKAERATIFLRHEGTVERVQAEAGVSLSDGTGGTMTAARADVRMTEQNQPQTAVFSGGVRYVAEAPIRQTRVDAAEGRADFDTKGHVEHVLMSGTVHMREQARSGPAASQSSSERNLYSKTLDLGLTTGSDGKIQLRLAKATGDAKLTVVSDVTGSQARTSSDLSGDMLTVTFRLGGGAGTKKVDGVAGVGGGIKTVHGEGHTVLQRVSATGAEEMSSGDTLDAQFRDATTKDTTATGTKATATKGTDTKAAGWKKAGGLEGIASAVQQGHVSLLSRSPAKEGDAKSLMERRASADRVAYDGTTDLATLTGGVQLTDVDSTLWADKVVIVRESGDRLADGSVRASYLQPKAKDPRTTEAKAVEGKAGEPVHVLAARAELKRATGIVVFYGGPGTPARLWQGVSQVAAPVIQFDQKERSMVARSDGGMMVHAVFLNASSLGKVGGAKPAPIRVASHDMTYSDRARRVDFSGGVAVEDGDGTMRAQQASVYLQAASQDGSMPGNTAAQKAEVPGGFMGGSVDRVVASGKVEIVQPGRKATGEQAVYTAADGVFVMTGTASALPRMMDEARGAITGASLRFHAGDNSVVVSNGTDGVAGQRVRTETRVKQ